MRFADTTYNLRIELDTHNCELSAGEIRHFEQALEPLRKPVEKFPVSDLYITVTQEARTHLFRVKTALVLPKRTLTTGEIAERAYPAFESCVRKLVRKVESYQASLASEEELKKHEKGTHQAILSGEPAQPGALDDAVRRGDYEAFRTATYTFEEPLRKRIGRWVQRYPELDERIGDDIHLADLVEEVFLNAFERYDQRPEEVRFGEWLDHLIDPSVRLVLEHPDEELSNISFVRSLRDTESAEE